MTRIGARHLHARRHAQGFRDARGPGTPDVFPRDDEDRCGRPKDLLRVLGNTGYLNIAELFQAQLCEALIALCSLGLGL